MLNVVKLVESINAIRTNDSSNDAILESIEAYDFSSMSAVGAIHETNNIMAADNADLIGYSVATDELIVEAAAGNAEVLTTLTENIGKSFIEGVKNFFKKAASMAKGLFNRIGVMLTKMTGRIDKWVAATEKKVEVAIKDEKKKGFTYSMWNYDSDVILHKLRDAADSLGSNYMDIKKIPDMVKADVAAAVASAGSEAKSGDIDAELLKAVVDALRSKAGIDVKIEGIGDLAKALTTRIYGEEKIKWVMPARASAMIKDLKEAKGAMTSLRDGYRDHAAALEAAANALDSAASKYAGAPKENDSEFSAAVAGVKKKLEDDVHRVRGYLTAVNTIKSANLKALNSMVTDYMLALSAFVGGTKAPKDDNKNVKEQPVPGEKPTEEK